MSTHLNRDQPFLRRFCEGGANFFFSFPLRTCVAHLDVTSEGEVFAGMAQEFNSKIRLDLIGDRLGIYWCRQRLTAAEALNLFSRPGQEHVPDRAGGSVRQDSYLRKEEIDFKEKYF